MYYDDLYKRLVSQVKEGICDQWPETAFACADWSVLTKNVKKAYRSISPLKRAFTEPVSIGVEKVSGLDVALPYFWNWTEYRGLILCPPHGRTYDQSEHALLCETAASILFRIYAMDTKKSLAIHKVDAERLGAMKILPNTLYGSVVEKRESLRSLINRLEDILEKNPVESYEWRCSSGANCAQAAINVVLIANWVALSPRNNVGLSEEQDAIAKLLRTSVAAQNGIYFVICSNEYLELEGLSQFVLGNSGNMGQHRMMAGELTLTASDRNPEKNEPRTVSLSYSLPTEKEAQILLEAQREFESGVLVDEDAGGLWKGNSAEGLRCIIGTTPKGKPQFLELGIGRGMKSNHILVGGATGSGKSVLLNEIICSLSERYSPEELRLVLLDFKEGTEFAPYKKLPHVLALSIGSNPEFGLESLKWLSKEAETRGELFKKADVENLPEYRRKTGNSLCRYLVIADEFQVLCNDRKYGEEAKKILNDLARRGRSFGVHLILSTQTLRDGALDGEAKNQFTCRICMLLAESETGYFLSDGNNEPARFTQPGQARPNYDLGRKEGNIFFRSGNPQYRKGYRERTDVQSFLTEVSTHAAEVGLMPKERFIYESEASVVVSPLALDKENGLILGVRNNMKGDPYYVKQRQLQGGILIIGSAREKNLSLLKTISLQTENLYGKLCPVFKSEEYLNSNEDYPLSIFDFEEGDVDMEDVLVTWEDQRKQKEEQISPVKNDETVQYKAPEGMEDEFAELMGSIQLSPSVATSPPFARRSISRVQHDLPLVVSLPSIEDVKIMEALEMHRSRFRIKVYTDLNSCRYFSSGDIGGDITSSQIVVEYPIGVLNKIRLITLKN